MPALNNRTTSDAYSPDTTLVAPGTRRVTIHARNAAILYQLGIASPAIQWDPDERFMPPGTLSGDRVCDAVRVRSATPGKPAQVSIDAGGPDGR